MCRKVSLPLKHLLQIIIGLGVIICIAAVYVAANAFFLLMVDYGVMLIDTYIEPESYLVSILLTACCYFGSLWLLRRKVKKVDMIESLKK